MNKDIYKKTRNAILVGIIISIFIYLSISTEYSYVDTSKWSISTPWYLLNKFFNESMQKFENSSFDNILRKRGPIKDFNIGIIAYDDQTYNTFTDPEKSFWGGEDIQKTVQEKGITNGTRLAFSRMIKNVSQFGVNTIGMDYLMESPKNKEIDDKFAKTIKKAKNVVIGKNMTFYDIGRRAGEYMKEPYSLFKENCKETAYINMPQDRYDGVCRTNYILTRYVYLKSDGKDGLIESGKVENNYSFALAVALDYLNIDRNTMKIVDLNDKDSIIKFGKDLKIPVKKYKNKDNIISRLSEETNKLLKYYKETYIMNVDCNGPKLSQHAKRNVFKPFSLAELVNDSYEEPMRSDVEYAYKKVERINRKISIKGKDLIFNKQGFTSFFPNEIKNINLDNYDEYGIIKKEISLKEGDPLFLALEPKIEIKSQNDLKPENFNYYIKRLSLTENEKANKTMLKVSYSGLNEDKEEIYIEIIKNKPYIGDLKEFQKRFPNVKLTKKELSKLNKYGFLKKGTKVRENDIIAVLIDNMNNKPFIKRFSYKEYYKKLLKSAKGVKEVKKDDDFKVNSFYSNADGKYQINITRNFVNNMIMLSGTTQSADQDFYPTSFDYGRQTPGIELHASAISTIINKRFYTRLSEDKRILYTILLCIILSIIFGVSKPIIGFIVLVIGELLYRKFAYDQFMSSRIWIDQAIPLLSFFIVFILNTVVNFIIEQKEKNKIKGAFSSYVNADVVNEMLKDPSKLKLGGEKKVLTVFFSDVAGFTTISEALSPEDLVILLNEYLGAMTDIILESSGLLDKYIGDAVMAAWGAPVDIPNAPERACQSAIDQLKKLRELREDWAKRGLPYVDARMGLNTGPMVVGNMGSNQRMNYTLMGDSVNLGARLEGINKQYGTNICISEFTYKEVKDLFVIRLMDNVRVKGKLEPVKIYELIDRPNKVSDDKKKVVKIFEEAFELYETQKFDEAIAKCQEALKIDPEDGPSKLYIKRCEEFKKNPPEESWDGVWTMKTK